jgi:hypothetical protein
MTTTKINRAPAAQPAVATPSSNGRPTLFSGWLEGWQMLKDWQLERQIHAARMALNSSRDNQSRRDAWQKMAHLIHQRSPQQVARMERKAGLA